MITLSRIVCCLGLIAAVNAQAQLSVTVSSPKTTGDKSVIELTLRNNLTNKIESARAAIFLTDNQGKMVGSATKWVIGGTKGRPALEPTKETTFNFVISSSRPLTTTNLTAKVTFSRVVLEDGKLADIGKEVTIQPASK